MYMNMTRIPLGLKTLRLLGFLTLVCLPVAGGTFSSGFDAGTPKGSKVFGSALVSGSGGVNNSGSLRLTTSARNQQGSWVLDDLDAGKKIGSFEASFKLRIGGGTGGEGFSFNFAPDLPNAAFGLEGAGLGLTISFDSYDNAGRGDAPLISVKFNGVTIARRKINPSTGSGFELVKIKVEQDGGLDLNFGATSVFKNLFAYRPIFGRFGLGARTSVVTDDHVVDDFSVTTTLATAPFVESVSPNGVGVQADLPVAIVLKDLNGVVTPGSVQLSVNGKAVVAEVSKNGDATSIMYQPSGLFPSQSVNSLKLAYQYDLGAPRAATAEFDFTVSRYTIIPARFAIEASYVDVTRPGFLIRTVQASETPLLPPTVARAEAQLNGTLGNAETGQLYQNEALPGPISGQFFSDDVLNYEQDATPTGDFVDTESLFPGIPGSGGHTDNFVFEAIGYLDLTAGFHRFGVNSDEGFRVTVSDSDPRDAFAIVVGEYDGGRSVGETQFSCYVEAAGYYPFRVLSFESDGRASVEFFSFLSDGSKSLVNDRSVPESIPAFTGLKPGAVTVPFVQSVSPAPGAIRVAPNPEVAVALVDGQSKVVRNSIQLKVDGLVVNPSINTANSLTQIAYSARTPFANGSVHTASLKFSDDTIPPNVITRDWTFTTEPEFRPVGQWNFDRGDMRAAMGAALAYGDGLTNGVAAFTAFGSTASFGIPGINGEPAAVMEYRKNGGISTLQPGYTLRHGIAPNGSGRRVNQWTLIMDVFFKAPIEGPLTSLLQLDDTTTDGDVFVRWNSIGGENTGGIGAYSRYNGEGRTSVHLGQWHRIAIASDISLNAPVLSSYVDGVKFQDQYLNPPQLDGRLSLGATIRLFADDNNEVTTFYVNSIQIVDGKLTDSQIAALGGPDAAGIPNKYIENVPTAIAPVITLEPADLTAAAGTAAVLKVTVVGSAPLTYQWKFNSEDIPGATNPTFTINNVQPPNAGDYSVEVANAGGTVISRDAKITVIAPAVIEKQPESQSVRTGSDVTFEVFATASPSPSYQWKFNTSNIAGATNATLVLRNVQAANVGSYTVVVGNFLGSVTSAPATLAVSPPPVITVHPKPATVATGSKATFNVTATGFEPLTYQWRFNTIALLGATNVSLVVTNVKAANVGEYSVRVTNPGGSVISDSARLTVLGPLVIIDKPLSQTVPVGTNVLISVSVSGTPPISYQWLFAGKNVVGATNEVLSLTNVQSADSGEYTVQITNPVSSIVSPSAKLTVLDPPLITGQPQAQTVAVGGVASFAVFASGEPPLNYEWLFNGVPIDGASSSFLVLTDVQTASAGKYSVNVWNSVGLITSAEASLTVGSGGTFKPEISKVTVTPEKVSFGFAIPLNVKVTVEYTDSLFQPIWTTLTNFTGTAQAANVTVSDAIIDNPLRFYRLRVLP